MSVVIEGAVLIGITAFVTVQTIRGKINWKKFWEEISRPRTAEEQQQANQNITAELYADAERFHAQLQKEDQKLRN